MDYDFENELRGDEKMSQGISRAADAAAAVSIPAWLVSLATDALPILQGFAAFVAIVTGIFAIAVYWRRLREK